MITAMHQTTTLRATAQNTRTTHTEEEKQKENVNEQAISVGMDWYYIILIFSPKSQPTLIRLDQSSA